MKLNIQMFGGRGASSSMNSKKIIIKKGDYKLVYDKKTKMYDAGGISTPTKSKKSINQVIEEAKKQGYEIEYK